MRLLMILIFCIVCYSSIGAGFHWLMRGDKFDFETASTWFYLFGWPAFIALVIAGFAAAIAVIVYIGMAFESIRSRNYR